MPKKSGYGNNGMGKVPGHLKPKPRSGGKAHPGTNSPNATYGTPSPGSPDSAGSGKGKHGGGNPY